MSIVLWLIKLAALIVVANLICVALVPIHPAGTLRAGFRGVLHRCFLNLTNQKELMTQPTRLQEVIRKKLGLDNKTSVPHAVPNIKPQDVAEMGSDIAQRSGIPADSMHASVAAHTNRKLSGLHQAMIACDLLDAEIAALSAKRDVMNDGVQARLAELMG